MKKYSKIILKGIVDSIDLVKRDITLLVSGIKVVVHMWTTVEDDHGTWRSDIIWKNFIHDGDFITLNGYMGNNGRVIAPPQNIVHAMENDSPINNASILAEVIDIEGNIINVKTLTPGRRDVISKITTQSVPEDLMANDLVAAIGSMANDGIISATNISKVKLEDTPSEDFGYESDEENYS